MEGFQLGGWSIDFAGPLSDTDSGGRYVLLAVEQLSNWPVASIIKPDMFSSIGVIKFVREQICVLYSNPVCILSDGIASLTTGLSVNLRKNHR